MKNNPRSIALWCLLCIASLAGAEPTAQETFHFLDTNADNQISLLEYKSEGEDPQELAWANQLNPVCTIHSLRAADPDLMQAFQSSDQNNDQSISLQEFITTGDALYTAYLVATFRQTDHNQDDKLNRAEFQQQANVAIMRLEQAIKSKDAIPAECLQNAKYWAKYTRQVAYYMPTLFDYLDYNRDASLTFEEYLGLHLLD